MATLSAPTNTPTIDGAVSIILAILGSDKAVNLIVDLIRKLADKPDNDFTPDYAEWQRRSLEIRNKKQAEILGENIFLPDDELQQIKSARKHLNPDDYHEQV